MVAFPTSTSSSIAVMETHCAMFQFEGVNVSFRGPTETVLMSTLPSD